MYVSVGYLDEYFLMIYIYIYYGRFCYIIDNVFNVKLCEK